MCVSRVSTVTFVRVVRPPVIDEYHPNKTNHERMNLHDLITFAIMTHIVFDGMYKRAYRLLLRS